MHHGAHSLAASENFNLNDSNSDVASDSGAVTPGRAVTPVTRPVGGGPGLHWQTPTTQAFKINLNDATRRV